MKQINWKRKLLWIGLPLVMLTIVAWYGLTVRNRSMAQALRSPNGQAAFNNGGKPYAIPYPNVSQTSARGEDPMYVSAYGVALKGLEQGLNPIDPQWRSTSVAPTPPMIGTNPYGPPATPSSLPNPMPIGPPSNTHRYDSLLRLIKEAKDGDTKEKLVETLKKILRAEFDTNHAAKAKQVETLDSRIQSAKKSLEQRAALKERIVERRLNELVGKSDPLDWEIPSVTEDPSSRNYTPSLFPSPIPAAEVDAGMDLPSPSGVNYGAYQPIPGIPTAPPTVPGILAPSPVTPPIAPTVNPAIPSPEISYATDPQPPFIENRLPTFSAELNGDSIRSGANLAMRDIASLREFELVDATMKSSIDLQATLLDMTKHPEEIDPTEFRITRKEVRRLEASTDYQRERVDNALTRLKLQKREADLRLEHARVQEQRIDAMHKKGVVSSEELDKSRLNRNSAETHVQILNAVETDSEHLFESLIKKIQELAKLVDEVESVMQKVPVFGN